MNARCFSQEEIVLIMIVDRLEGLAAEGHVDDHLVLPYNLRRKARQRVRLQSGREAAIFLPRGAVLHNGDILVSQNGLRLKVDAAREKVSVAQIDDGLLLAKIAYHLGNRHVAVQVKKDRLIYLHDHVLDHMVRGLGGAVMVAMQQFDPEEGAYHGGSCHHSH